MGDPVVTLVILGVIVYFAWVIFGNLFSSRGRGRMLCPICGRGLKGTTMVTIAGTVYHERCWRKSGRSI